MLDPHPRLRSAFRRSLLRAVPAGLAAVFLVRPAAASTRADRKITITDFTTDERALFDDARDDKFDKFDLVTAAIAASDATAASKAMAAAHWKDFLDGIIADAKTRAPRERAEWLLGAVHAQLLTGGYAWDQNDIVRLLDIGEFNCVTSSIVYEAAALHVGLDVRGIKAPSHVYVQVAITGAQFIAETTSVRGFGPERDDESYAKYLAADQLMMELKYGHKTAKEKFYRREIDAVDLIAELYLNRGDAARDHGKQADAVPLYSRCALLSKDERECRNKRDFAIGAIAEACILKNDFAEARRLYASAVHDPGGDPIIDKKFREDIGYCFALEAAKKIEKGDFEGGIAAYAEGADWSEDPALTINQQATFSEWGLKELDAKRYAHAAEIFKREQKIFPKESNIPHNLKATYSEWTDARIAAKDCDGALSSARELRALLPDDSDSSNVFASVASRCADVRLDAHDYSGAGVLMDEALAAAPSMPNLREYAAAVWTNVGVAWLRDGNDAKAEAAWKRALEVFPGATVARTNLERTHHTVTP